MVGRQFWDRIVAYIQSAGDGEAEIVPQALSALRSRELIYRREESAFVDAHEYLFKHDILREVTYESVLKRLRRIYHGLVADWLIAQGAGRTEEYNGLIAEHLLLADRKEQAGQYFIQAGEAALASYANGEAEAHFRKALGLRLTDVQRAAALSGLGEALKRRGMHDEAIQVFRQAIELYLEFEDFDRAADLFARLSRVTWFMDHLQAWNICQEGLARLAGAADSPGMAYLLAEAGRTAHFRVQPKEKIVSLCNQAIAMSERVGIVEPRAEASITLALIIEDDPQEAIEILLEAAALSEAHGLLHTTARAYHNLVGFNDVSMGGAGQSFQYGIRSAELNRRIGNIDQMLFSLGGAMDHRVDLDSLNSLEGYAAEFLRKSSATDAQVEKFLQYIHHYFLFFRGEWAESLEYVRQQQQELRKGGSIHNIFNLNLWLSDTLLELNWFNGQDTFAEAESALQENIAMQWHAVPSQFILMYISARKGLIHEARARLAEALQASAHMLFKVREAGRLQGEIELARAEGDWDQAIFSCRALIDLYQPGGYRWSSARRLIDLGDAFTGRDGPGDRTRAQEAYQQALEMFTEMGAPGYVRVLEERLGVTP